MLGVALRDAQSTRRKQVAYLSRRLRYVSFRPRVGMTPSLGPSSAFFFPKPRCAIVIVAVYHYGTALAYFAQATTMGHPIQ